MSTAGWVLLVAADIVLTAILFALLAALLAGLALAVPARIGGSSPLRMALAPTAREVSRLGALEASAVWIRAYTTTSRGVRLVRILLTAAAVPVAFGSARWRRRALQLTAPGAGLRVLQRRDGSWQLVDVAGWPVGAGQARPLLLRVCTAADTAGVTIILTASDRKVAAEVYAPLGFRTATSSRLPSVRMSRPPRPAASAAQLVPASR